MTLKATAIFALLAATALAGSQALQAAEANPPRLKFKAEAPLQLPDDIHFGELPGVAVNSKGHVFAFSRGNSTGHAKEAAASQLLEFDPSGKFVREIGHNLYAWSFAHGVRVDKDDNIWAIDKGSSTIIKFNPAGRVVDNLGRKVEASDYHPEEPTPKAAPHRMGTYGEPTDIAFDSQGNGYISDGYKNSRVVKVDKKGYWVRQWGERGTGPGQFLTPHGVVVDAKDNVYVADRGNARVQVFDTNGKFVRQFTLQGQVPYYAWKEGQSNPTPRYITGQAPKPRGDDPNVPKAYPDAPPQNLTGAPGAPDAICITSGPNQVLYIGDLNPGRIYKVSLEGKVLGMLGEPGNGLGEFRSIHGLTCVGDKTLWVADMGNWRVQKITLE